MKHSSEDSMAARVPASGGSNPGGAGTSVRPEFAGNSASLTELTHPFAKYANQPPACPDSRDNLEPWEKDYIDLIRKWAASGAIDILQGGNERREFPRFKLKSKSITIQVESQFPVVDLSLSGISFHSSLQIGSAQTINLVLEKTFQVEVEVIDCRRVDQEQDGHVWPYRVHCRFVNPRHGMQLLVLLNEMDDLAVVHDNAP